MRFLTFDSCLTVKGFESAKLRGCVGAWVGKKSAWVKMKNTLNNLQEQ